MSTNESESNEPVPEGAATSPSEPAPSAAPAPPPQSPAPGSSPYAQPGYAPSAQPGYAPYAQPGYDPAFAPVPRAPRSRWIAPQRKAAVIVIALVCAVVLLGLGALGGSLMTSHHDHASGFQRHGFSRLYPEQGGGHDGHPFAPRASHSAAPTPSPSTSTTS
jgi:hypothetical protein